MRQPTSGLFPGSKNTGRSGQLANVLNGTGRLHTLPTKKRTMNEVMTIKECAAYLRVSDRTIRRMIWDGTIKPLKTRGAIRIHRRALEKAVGISYSSSYSFVVKNSENPSALDYDSLVKSLDNVGG